MTWSRTLEVAPQIFENLTSTYGHVLSYAREGPDIKNFIYYYKVFGSFLVILVHVKKPSYMEL